MKKLLILLFALTSLYSGGCILAQQGKVKVSLKDVDFKTVSYKAIKKEGKNFKEILVGSSIIAKSDTNSLKAKITDIKANKRIRKEPRTGTITMLITLDNQTKQIPFNYKYDKGIMKIKDKKDSKLNFHIKIKAILCSSSIK